MQSRISQLALELQQRHKITGVGVGVIFNDHLPVVAVSGKRQHKGAHAVESTDKWHIGSITKSVTATLLARLVEEKQFKFDDALIELLPDISMHTTWHGCTLHHLLTHTSGIQPNFPLNTMRIQTLDAATLFAEKKRLLTAILAKPARKPPGKSFSYSNAGYTLAGFIAESRLNKPIEQLLAEYVFDPLKLDSAGIGPPMGTQPSEQPMGHKTFLGFRKTVDPFNGIADNSTILSAAGRAHMNLNDLLAYGKAHLAGEQGSDELLPQDKWKFLHEPKINGYACVWINEEKDWANGNIIWHNGSNTMWYALLMLVPAKRLVMAFTCNEGSMFKSERAFAMAAKDLASGLQ